MIALMELNGGPIKGVFPSAKAAMKEIQKTHPNAVKEGKFVYLGVVSANDEYQFQAMLELVYFRNTPGVNLTKFTKSMPNLSNFKYRILGVRQMSWPSVFFSKYCTTLKDVKRELQDRYTYHFGGTTKKSVADILKLLRSVDRAYAVTPATQIVDQKFKFGLLKGE